MTSGTDGGRKGEEYSDGGQEGNIDRGRIEQDDSRIGCSRNMGQEGSIGRGREGIRKNGLIGRGRRDRSEKGNGTMGRILGVIHSRNKEKVIKVKLLNVGGLTNEKYTELEREIGEQTLLCLTETQKKVDDIKRAKDIKGISSMREDEEKRGGGLMVMYREREGFRWAKIENGIPDILEIEGRLGDIEARIFLCYFRTGNEEEIIRGNRELREYILGRIEQIEQEIGIMVLGDFNGHLGYLGDQVENRTGKLINEMIDGGNLNLLNIDDRCR